MGTHVVLKILRSRRSRVIIICLCAFLAFGVVRSVYSLSQKRGILGQQQAMLGALQDRNRQLTARLAEATSSAFVERVARDKLGLVKEGESVVIMDKTQNPDSGDQEKLQNLPSWKQWWGLFF